MAINTLATATLFMTQLDKIAVQEATTGWMDANAGQVIYNGGSEVKIPKMSVQGMGDYDREAGYQRGSVTLEYETRKMTQDRGRLFQLDPMDINEANSKGTMLLLRVQMIEYHSKYTKMGDIPSYAYQNFCEMYEAYHRLGGNGMVTKMKQEIEELHIKRKGE